MTTPKQLQIWFPILIGRTIKSVETLLYTKVVEHNNVRLLANEQLWKWMSLATEDFRNKRVFTKSMVFHIWAENGWHFDSKILVNVNELLGFKRILSYYLN